MLPVRKTRLDSIDTSIYNTLAINNYIGNEVITGTHNSYMYMYMYVCVMLHVFITIIRDSPANISGSRTCSPLPTTHTEPTYKTNGAMHMMETARNTHRNEE